ncbi:hypothetical protein EV361DRAFT_604640 [Lentinula raphanica]|nr:hypothetical protein EV361DRAFT_604640 [Lentinula raphanica]
MRSEYRWGLSSPNQSPYNSLFKTNYAATSSERSELETLIFEAQQELTDLDSDISRMRAVLDGLCARRSQVQEFVDVHRALMAPIRRIPAETLAEIFTHCLSTERYPIRSLMEAPLLLTMVCRQWREVAITQPPLWSALHIHVALRIACDAEELAVRQEGVRQWIARAGALPLSLSLSLEGRIHTSALNFLTTLMDLSPRLENFDLNVGARMYTLLKNVSPRTFPILKRLSLNLQFGENHGDSATEIPFVPRISSDMPMLVGLSIHGFDPTQYLYPAFDGTRNLTELNLGTSHRTPSCIPLEQLLGILIRTPNLKICCASVSGPTVAQTYEIVNLNSLHSLCIYFWESRSLQPYHERDIPSGLIEKSFRSLNCPALKALSVTWKQYDFDHNGMDQHHSAFTHLLGSLQHLRLEFTMTDEALMECLALAQNVTVLEIVDWVFAVRTWGAPPGTHRHYYQVQDTVLQRLTSEPSSTVVLCPHLEIFRLLVSLYYEQPGKSELVSISTPALLNFLESRRGTGNQTSKLRICDILMPAGDQSSTTVLARFTHLMQDGLRLRVIQSDCNSYHRSGENRDAPAKGVTYYSSDNFPCLYASIFDAGYGLRNQKALVNNISPRILGHLIS